MLCRQRHFVLQPQMFLFQFALTQFPDGADDLVSVQFHSAALLSLSKMDDTIENGYRLMS